MSGNRAAAARYKVTFLDDPDPKEYRSSMWAAIQVEKKWPLSAVISEEGGVPTIQPRPELEMVIYGAYLASGSHDEFAVWASNVEQVEVIDPSLDPTPPVRGDD